MLTENFHYYFQLLCWNLSAGLRNTDGGVITLTSNELTRYRLLEQSMGKVYSKYQESAGVFFSESETTPSINDFKPTTDMASKLSITPPSEPKMNWKPDYYEFTSTFTVTANSDTKISSIGLVAKIGSFYFLLDNTKLEKPIYFKRGDTKSVKYFIRFHYQKT